MGINGTMDLALFRKVASYHRGTWGRGWRRTACEWRARVKKAGTLVGRIRTLVLPHGTAVRTMRRHVVRWYCTKYLRGKVSVVSTHSVSD